MTRRTAPSSWRRTVVERADPDRACPHEDFQALVDVARIAKSDDDPTIVGYSAEIRVHCANCDEPFRWTGPYEVGMVADRPTVDASGTELRAPLRPASGDDDFGMGLGGFTVVQR